jgi:Protein of unknown function (DUF4230)
MKTIIATVLAATLAGMLLIGCWGYVRRLTDPIVPIPIKDVGPTVEEIQSLGHLTVSKISVSDVLTAEADGFRGCWLVKGDDLLALDLRHAVILDKDEKTKTATILLPRLEVMQPRVDHNKTLTWSVEKITWVPWRNDSSPLRDQAMAQAQNLIEHAVRLPECMNQGRENAEIIIKNMYRMIDWSLDVNWKETEHQVQTAEATSPR